MSLPAILFGSCTSIQQSPTTSTQVLTPSQIRIAARRTALEQIDIQREEFKLLGIMADWEPGLDVIVDSNQISGPEKDIGKGGSQEQNSVYRTLDSEYEMRQLRVFGKMVKKGTPCPLSATVIYL